MTTSRDSCTSYIPTSMMYGDSCAVCGYRESLHRPATGKAATPKKNTSAARPRTAEKSMTESKTPTTPRASTAGRRTSGVSTDRPSTAQSRPSTAESKMTAPTPRSQTARPSSKAGSMKETTAYKKVTEHVGSATQRGSTSHGRSNSKPESKKYNKQQPTARTADRRELMNSVGLDYGESDKHKASDAAGNSKRPRGKAPKKHREPDGDEVMLKSALDKQANLLALAADAARHNGDSAMAQTLYMESADAAMDKLRLDVSSLKKTSGRKFDARGGSGSKTGDRRDWSDRDYTSERRTQEGCTWAGAISTYTKDKSLGSSAGNRGYLDVGDGGGRGPGSGTKSESLNKGPAAELLTAVHYGSSEKGDLTKLFYRFTGGAPGMTTGTMGKFLAGVGCPGDTGAYFCAFDRTRKRTWIDLADFVLGCAALDDYTPHTGKWRPERLKYIFRYYADDGVKLTRDQFYDIVEHMSYVDDYEDPEKFIEKADRLFASGNDVMSMQTFVNVCSNAPKAIGGLFRYNILDKA